MRNTPIFILTRDRQTYLKRVLDQFVAQGYRHLHLIDTGSTWPAMLEYQATLRFPIERVDPPHPPKYALWNCELLKKTGHEKDWFVLTDDDILVDGPKNWLELLHEILEARHYYNKAGLALRIDDLPDHYGGKADVLKWEAQFWKAKVSPNIYDAQIDTTLALYRPGTGPCFKALRLAGRWQARHLMWYEDTSHPTEERLWYRSHMRPKTGFWRNHSIAGAYKE